MGAFRNLESIKESLLKRLERDWKTDRSRFDPFVDKMAGALAAEVEKLYFDLDERDQQILERLAYLLVPDRSLLARPAFAVAQVQISANFVDLPADLSLEYQIKKFNEPDQTWYFSPAKAVSLLNAQLRYCLAGKDIFPSREGRLQVPDQPLARDIIHITDFCLGIEISPAVTQFRPLHIYLDIPISGGGELGSSRHFVHALSQSMVSIGPQKLDLYPGIKTGTSHNAGDHLGGYQLSGEIESAIKDHFITLDSEEAIDLTWLGEHSEQIFSDYLQISVPDESLRASLSQKLAADLENSEGNLIWIKFDLSSPLAFNLFISNLYIGLNHFPLINRRLKSLDPDPKFAKGIPQVVRLDLESEFLLGIKEVIRHPSGKYLEFRETHEFNPDEPHTYTVRINSIGRLDNYNVWRRFKYLFQVFKKEYRYRELFDLIGQDFVLSELERVINDKELESGGTTFVTDRNYLLISSFWDQSIDQYKIRYWTTQGIGANGIPAGTYLQVSSGAVAPGVDGSSFRLVTPSGAGTSPANNQQILLKLKSHLLQPAILVTDDQIKGYCRMFLGEDQLDIICKFGLIYRDNGEDVPTRSKEVILRKESLKAIPDSHILSMLESNLNQQARGSLPIKVLLKEGDNR